MCRVCSPDRLTDLALGHIRGWQAVYLRLHLRTCACCRAELESLAQISAVAHTVQEKDASPELRARIWSEFAISRIPLAPASPVRDRIEGPGRRSLALRLGVLAIAAGALSVFLFPSRTPSHTSMAAEIRQAVSRVDTWHLKGWKLQNGRQVIWEVWGRRTPFFYREQVGDDVIVDDGARRISAFAPLDTGRGGRRSTGVLVASPSLHEAENVRWSYQKMVAQWSGDLRPVSQNAGEAVFNFPETGIFSGGEFGTSTDLLYYVSLQTRLPRRYVTRLGKPEEKRTIAQLDADYNSPIPAGATAAPKASKGYKLYDATQPLPIEQNMATANGITVQATPLLVGPDGQVLLQIRTWFGSILLDGDGPLRVNISALRWSETEALNTPANLDDQKRGYTQVSWEPLQAPRDRASVLILLTPVDPIAPGAPPSQLSIRLGASPQMDTRLSGTMGIGDGQLSRQEMALTVALPPPSEPIERGAREYLDLTAEQGIFRADCPDDLASATDLARALFYGASVDGRRPDRPRLSRAIAYYEKYFRESPSASSVALFRRTTAHLCLINGERERARRMLQAVLDDKRLDVMYRDIGKNVAPNMTSDQRRRYVSESQAIVASYRRHALEALKKISREP